MYQDELIAKAYELNIISDSQLALMHKANFWALSKLGDAFTGGLSTSLPAERLNILLRHHRFVIDVYLESLKSDRLALKALIEQTDLDVLQQHYNLGIGHISNYAKAAKLLHQKALSTTVKIPHYTYHETLYGAIKSFFKSYIPNFESHLIYITADYPLMDQSVRYGDTDDAYLGIVFIYRYLEGFYFENKFCSYFDVHEIEGLLRAYNPMYVEEVFNFTSRLFLQVLGLALLKKEIGPQMSIKLTRVDLEKLYLQFYIEEIDDDDELHQAKLEGLVSYKIDSAFERIKVVFDLDSSITRYFLRCLPLIKGELMNAIKHDLLNLCLTVYT